MRIQKILHIAHRNAAHNKKRTLFLLFGTWIVITILTFLLSCSHIMITYFEERKLSIYGDYNLLMNQVSLDRVMDTVGEDVARTGIIKTYGDYEIKREQGPSLKGKLGAFDSDAQIMARMEFLQGHTPGNEGEIALEQGVYLRLLQGRKSIENIEVVLINIDGEVYIARYAISGIYRNISDVWIINQEQYVIPSILIAYNSNEEFETAVLVKYKSNSDTSLYTQKLAALPNNGFFENNMISGPQDKNEQYRKDFIQIALAISLLFLVAMFICSMQTAKAMLSSRSRQYSIIRKLGGKRRDILLLSSLETVYAYLLCIPAGLLSGHALSFIAIWIGGKALLAEVPFFISGIAIITVIASGLMISLISWGVSIKKIKKRSLRRRILERHLVRRAAIGRLKSIHSAILGATIACFCFLLLPFLTRTFSIYSLYPVIDYFNKQQGEYFIYCPGSGYSSLMYIPDNLNVGVEYTDLQELRKISEVKNISYFYDWDRIKISVRNSTQLENKAVKKSLLEESNFGRMTDKQEIDSEKLKYGYVMDGEPENLALGTLSGADSNVLLSLSDRFINGKIDIAKLESGEGVMVIDVVEIEGDENIFMPGERVDISQLAWNKTKDDPDACIKYDIQVEVIGTVSLSKDEVGKYFNPGYTYADMFLDGLGIRFLWGAASFGKKNLPVEIEYVAVTLEDPYDYDEVQAYVDEIEMKIPGIAVMSKPVASQLRLGLETIITVLSALISLSIFITGMLSIGFAFFANILQRSKEHGILKSIGMTRRTLSSEYMEYGMSVGLLYSLICVVLSIIFYIIVQISEVGSLDFFLKYMQTSGLWYRMALCVTVQTLTAGLLGALLFRRNDKSINEAIRYE